MRIGSSLKLRLGLEHFNRDDYGLAERYFRYAVEKAPRDATAWIGVAASYDASAGLILPTGPTARRSALSVKRPKSCDLRRARAKFLKAYEPEPDNPPSSNNLQLLNSSSRFIQREE